ncbi:MAG TPA: hypothetical protein VFD50_03930 [Thermoleophilia bacterium]|nr:hypothetical protein [Thermoleophilia bacterium]
MGETNGRERDAAPHSGALGAPRMLEALQALVDANDQPVFALDHEFRYTAFNRAHADVMRALYGAEIALGGRILDHMTVEGDRKTACLNLDQAISGETVTASAFSGDDLMYRAKQNGKDRVEQAERAGSWARRAPLQSV